jgi:hypothetical protein
MTLRSLTSAPTRCGHAAHRGNGREVPIALNAAQQTQSDVPVKKARTCPAGYGIGPKLDEMSLASLRNRHA